MRISRLKKILTSAMLVIMIGMVSTAVVFADSRSNTRDYAVGSGSLRATISSSTGSSNQVTSCNFTASPLTGVSVTASKSNSNNYAYGYFDSLYLYESKVNMYAWPAKVAQHRWVTKTSCKLSWYSYSNGSTLYSE